MLTVCRQCVIFIHIKQNIKIKKGVKVKVKIKETGKIQELELIDHKTGCSYVVDYIFNTGTEDFDNFDPDTETYECTQYAFDWWSEYIDQVAENEEMLYGMGELTPDEESQVRQEFRGVEFNDIPALHRRVLLKIKKQREYRYILKDVVCQDTLDSVIDNISSITELNLPYKKNTYLVIIFDDNKNDFWLAIDQLVFHGEEEFEDYMRQVEYDLDVISELKNNIETDLLPIW